MTEQLLVQQLVFGVVLDDRLKLALFVTCIGVALATVNDVEVNFIGTVWAVLGLLGAVFYQLFVKTKQKALNASSFQVSHAPPKKENTFVALISSRSVNRSCTIRLHSHS